MTDIDKQMAERRARVEASQKDSDLEATEKTSAAPKEDPPTNYWKLPKTAGRTTIFNSTWTWTLITYVAIMAIAALSMSQNGVGFLDSQSNTARTAIAAGLIYPAWRIGSLISKFLKKREIGAGISVSDTVKSSLGTSSSSAKTAKPGSVEARMEERRARLEKARQEGKI